MATQLAKLLKQADAIRKKRQKELAALSNQYLEVSVTQEHIRKGEPGEGYNCPIALAVMDVVGEDCKVSVGDSIEINDIEVCSDRRIGKFVSAFDRTEDKKGKELPLSRVKPFKLRFKVNGLLKLDEENDY